MLTFSIAVSALTAEQDPNSVDPVKIEMAVAELDMITDVLYVVLALFLLYKADHITTDYLR